MTKSVKAKKVEKEPNWNYIKFFKRPELVDTLPEGQLITKVFSGGNYCYAINEKTNDVFSWGFGENYVLGTREDENCFLPNLVNPKMFYDCKVRYIGTGNNHCVVLTSASPEVDTPPQFDFSLPMPVPEDSDEEEFHTA